MKKVFLLFYILSGAGLLNAQVYQRTTGEENRLKKHDQLFNQLLNRQIQTPNLAQKPTGIKQRVIAQASHSNGLGLVPDTAVFKYSGSRGSKFDPNMPGYSWDFSNDFLTEQPFYISVNKTMDLLADSIIHYKNGLLKKSSRAFYGADNRLDSFTQYFPGQFNSLSKTIHQFNDNGYMVSFSQSLASNGQSGYYDYLKREFWYDSNETMIQKDTLYQSINMEWRSSSFTNYHYNAQNYLDSIITYEKNNADSTTHIKSQANVLYDANNRIVRIKTLEYNTDTTSVLYIDSLGYTGSSFYFDFLDKTILDNGNSQKIRIIKFQGNNNLPDSSVQYYYDNTNADYVVDLYSKFYYNSFNNPDSILVISNGSTIGSYNFYYDTYDDTPPPPSAIKEISNNRNFSIYPNPFENKINIDWKNKASNKSRISLMNVVGQKVFTTTKYLVSGNNSVDFPVLIGGQYVLLIQDDEGNTWSYILIKK